MWETPARLKVNLLRWILGLESGFETWPGQCVVFWGETPDSHSVSLRPGVGMGTGKPRGIQTRGSSNSNTSSRLMLWKLGRAPAGKITWLVYRLLL